MHKSAVKVIAEKRAAWATLFPAGAEHKVIDDQLAFVAKKIGQRFLTVRAIEDVILFYFYPGQFAASCAERVAAASELLFLGEQLPAGGEPVGLRHYVRLVSLTFL